MGESWIVGGQKWYLSDKDLDAVRLGALHLLIADRLPAFVDGDLRLDAIAALRKDFAQDELPTEALADRMWRRACEVVRIPAETPALPPSELRDDTHQDETKRRPAPPPEESA